MSEILILGDSIARGVYFDPEKGKYSVLQNTYAGVLTAAGHTVKNMSKIGCTVTGGAEIYQKCEHRPGTIAVVEFGGNDADLNWDEVAARPDRYHEAAVSLADFADRLTALVRQIRQDGLKPVLVTPLPVRAQRYYRWISQKRDEYAILSYLGNAEYIYRWQERYALEVMKTAQREQCPVLDLRTEFLIRKDLDELMCIDGIHPNARGHELISTFAARTAVGPDK